MKDFGALIGVSETSVFYYSTFKRTPGLLIACKIKDATENKVLPWELLPPGTTHTQEELDV